MVKADWKKYCYLSKNVLRIKMRYKINY